MKHFALLLMWLLTLLLGGVRDADAQLDLERVARRTEPGFRAIYEVDRSGGTARFLAAAPGMISTATPEWSHDGMMLAMDAVSELQRFSTSRIFVADVAGAHRGRIRDLGFGNVPTWSPDDQTIAFMLNPGNPAGVPGGIWMMRSDGSDRQHVCSGMYPRWSPDGSRLCVQDNSSNPNRLRIYDTRTGAESSLLGDRWVVTYAGATWMADGRSLAFVGEHDGRQHVAVCNVQKGEDSVSIVYTELDPSRTLVGPPTVSPDNREIVFGIQDAVAPAGVTRQWAGTYLYRCHVQPPQPPRLLEPRKLGVINRGMMWSPDGTRIAFSSER